ncbi:MAG: endolytic transglycosylase MltG [Bacteroidales bacterium]|nr:endolytic transglycosylase MltG [Bacteroidales bacterium]MCF8326843.1 endolytic transglycosylase MltG [Bacteroidales bacterium]
MVKKKKRNIFFIILLLLMIALGAFAYIKYKSVFIKPAAPERTQSASVFIPSQADFETLKDSIFKYNLISDSILFEKVARYKDLPQNIHGGHYQIAPEITLNQLINKFSSGLQTPVYVTFNNIRKIEEFAGSVGKQLELDSTVIMHLLHSEEILNMLNTSEKKLLGYFIPNTYEFYWNISAKAFFKRMKKEHERFWNSNRRAQARAIGLSPHEVATLASIVQEETNQTSEMDKIAGVYINRLNHGMLLQADPTLKYAIDDWSIRRVLNKHKTIDSPYNTYKYAGLPPGPICMPEPKTIDQVLNFENHNYFYFVASVDSLGFHSFSKTLREHNRKANRYRRYLNQNRIYQ